MTNIKINLKDMKKVNLSLSAHTMRANREVLHGDEWPTSHTRTQLQSPLN